MTNNPNQHQLDACSTCRSHTNCKKAGCCLYPQTTVLPAAPPKPAPDAVREALQRQCDNMAFVINHCVLGPTWYDKFKRELGEDRNALAAPVPPPDGAVDSCPVCGINRASPFPCEHASPSPAVAAEPARELDCILNSLMLAVHDNQGNVPFVKTRLRSVFKEVLQPLYATPPVRGDR